MQVFVSLPLTNLADALAASTVMRTFIMPVVATLCAVASLVCSFFLVTGGIEYMVSRGKPDGLEHAKRTIRNALTGLVLVIAAAVLTAILTHIYSASGASAIEHLPTLAPIKESDTTSFWDVVVKAIVHVLEVIIQSIGQPFIQALDYFTKSTPLMGDNSAVFNMWLVIAGIADVLFILVVALLGFHVMSFSTLGFEELDIKQLIPQLALVFLLINTSLFAIDAVIGLSNVMVHALQAAFPPLSLWDLLAKLTQQSTGLGLGGLLVMAAFLILTVMLLVYYVGRLITLYIGAALSPLIILIYLLPAFKDFAVTAAKVYLTTIFVLFVQVVIMLLASSIFLGMLEGSESGQPNTLMALIVGVATMVALLKTQGVMKELSYAASTPRAARQMAGSFIRGVSYMQRLDKQRQRVIQTTKRGSSAKGGKTPSGGNGSSGKTHLIPASALKTGETRRAFSTPVSAGAATSTMANRSMKLAEEAEI